MKGVVCPQYIYTVASPIPSQPFCTLPAVPLMSRVDPVQLSMPSSYTRPHDDEMEDDAYSVISADSTGSMLYARSSSSATSLPLPSVEE